MKPGPLLYLAYWLLFMIGGRSRLLKDPGTFWHTRIGELIIQNGFFRTDPFTFTHAGQYWIPHQWLGEVAMHFACRCAGLDTFVLLASTMLAGLFTWLTLRLMRTGLHVSLAILIVCIAISATATHLHVRPILFTTFAMALTAALLADCEAGRIPLNRLFWLVPLFVVWTNIHGGMLGGLASLGLVIAGWIVWKVLGWPTPIHCRRDVLMVIFLGFACAMTMFANPYGTEIPRTWIKIMQGSKIAEYIEEHQPLDPQQPGTWGALLFAGVYLVTLAGTLPQKPRITWLLPIFWMLQMFLRVRHAPLFAMTGCVAVAAMWPHTRWARLLLKRPDLYDPSKPISHSTWGWLLPAFVVALSFTLQAAGVHVPVLGAGWAEPDPKTWPMELLPELRQHEPKPGAPNAAFNELHLGGFLSFYAPGYKTFIDDRGELYADDWFEDVMQGSSTDTANAIHRWEAQHGQFRFALVVPGTYFDAYFANDRDWFRVKGSAAANFYRRR